MCLFEVHVKRDPIHVYSMASSSIFGGVSLRSECELGHSPLGYAVLGRLLTSEFSSIRSVFARYTEHRYKLSLPVCRRLCEIVHLHT